MPKGRKENDWEKEMLIAARELQYPQIVWNMILKEKSEFKCTQIMTFARYGYYD